MGTIIFSNLIPGTYNILLRDAIGCNAYGGEYTYEEREFRVGELISTMMTCDEPTPEFESKFLGVLRDATDFRIRKNMLFVTDTKTHRTLKFVSIIAG